MIEWQIEALLNPSYPPPKLKNYFYPATPNYPLEVFKWLEKNIRLTSSGMGVEIMHSRYELMELMKLEEEMDYKILLPFIERFESLVWEKYNRENKDR